MPTVYEGAVTRQVTSEVDASTALTALCGVPENLGARRRMTRRGPPTRHVTMVRGMSSGAARWRWARGLDVRSAAGLFITGPR
jgi:hypothetical protein